MDVDYLRLVNAEDEEIDETLLKFYELPAFLTPYLTEKEFQQYSSLWKKKHTSVVDEEIYGWNLFEEVARYAVRAYKLAQTIDHDIIHAHDWMTFKAAINAKKVSGKPLVVHIHATEYERTAGNPNPMIYEYEKEGMLAADEIIAVSEKTKEKIVAHYGIDPNKIEVVHNAVDVPNNFSFEVNEDDPDKPYKLVLFLARMAPSKGADYLLRAAAKVLKKMSDVKFVFVGKGGMLDDMIDLSIDLGITKNVIFTGFLNHDQVDQAYRQADLFVMPSVAEPFGITALEAIRNGTPVLMSKQSGASEVIQNCLKVDFWDIDEMANKILAVLSHGTLADTLKVNGIRDLERITWDSQSQRVLDIYQRLM
jgi:glycosyltransferase involved in cell wall biosynthesis